MTKLLGTLEKDVLQFIREGFGPWYGLKTLDRVNALTNVLSQSCQCSIHDGI